jgi:alkylation response protein AidB-like acyl-CoA dehydrogenase
METLREWLLDEVLPKANAWEESQILPEEILSGLSRHGLTGACVPAAWGGQALDSLALGEAAAWLARGSCSLMSIFVVHAMVAQALSRFGDAAQQRALLPRLARGEWRAAFALTEPGFGSDAANIACAARRVEGGFLLNGQKKWISAACHADLFLVMARLEDAGPSAFLVPKGTPGLSVSPMKDLLGFRAAGIGEIEFRECFLPEHLALPDAPAALLGAPGGGFSFVASYALDTGRFIAGWAGAGVMEGCLEASIAYAGTRSQFGQTLRSHQLIRAMIADMATDLAAARALLEKAAAARDAGEPDAVLRVTQAKYFSSAAAARTAAAAVQLFGGNGCAPEFPVQRYFRDAKILEIIEGSSQMQQLMISSAVLVRGRRKRHDR